MINGSPMPSFSTTPEGRKLIMFFERAAQPLRRVRTVAVVLPVLLAPLFVSACASDQDIDLATYVEQTDPADVLYNQGLANMNAGRLGEASKKFNAIDRQHPYSEYGRKALVMGAFADYRQGKYEEAINSGKRYVQLYPTDPDAAYAQYIVGLSYFRQIRDVTQDQKESRRAIEAMDEVVQRWPESEYVDDARSKVLAAAHAAHPERFVRQTPRPPQLPTAAWINPPQPTSDVPAASEETRQ